MLLLPDTRLTVIGKGAAAEVSAEADEIAERRRLPVTWMT